MALRENNIVQSSNLVKVVMNGTEMGLIQNFTVTDDYSPESASGVGDARTQQWVPTQARHTISCSMMLFKKATLITLGIVPENVDAVLQNNEFDVEVYDKTSGQLLRKVIGLVYANGSVDIRKHSIVIHNATFNARDTGGTLRPQ